MSILYWKCKGDCLEVVATEFDITREDKCSICGGTFAFMGIVQDDKLVRTEERCACNHSCTHAHGPRCDCGCHGANHGTGMVVHRVIVNGIPTIPAHDAEKAMARMQEWRPIRKKIDHGIEIMKIIGQIRSSGYAYTIRYTAWSFVKEQRKIKQLKSHFYRLKNGKKLIERMNGFIDSLVTNYSKVVDINLLTDLQKSYYGGNKS